MFLKCLVVTTTKRYSVYCHWGLKKNKLCTSEPGIRHFFLLQNDSEGLIDYWGGGFNHSSSRYCTTTDDKFNETVRGDGFTVLFSVKMHPTAMCLWFSWLSVSCLVHKLSENVGEVFPKAQDDVLKCRVLPTSQRHSVYIFIARCTNQKHSYSRAGIKDDFGL